MKPSPWFLPVQPVVREDYLLQNNHLYEAGFFGLAENLPLFERVADTNSFPPKHARP